MGGKRLYTVSALLSLGTLASCAVDTNEPATGPKLVAGEDWGDPNKYPELGGAYSTLTAALGTCTFTAKTGAVVIDLSGAAQTVVIAKRSADSLLLVNGDEKFCDDSVSSAATTVPTKNIKTVTITDTHASNVQNVVLDFLAGTFGAGAKGKAGITVDLGGGADSLAIRGTAGKDTFAVGDTGVAAGATSFAINGDAFGDIDMVSIANLTVSLAGGDDTFTGAGGFGTGNAFATALTIFGGEGKDNLTGGAGNDSVYGGDGDDTVTGGAGDDVLNGDDGDDVITQGAAPDGADTIVCGDGYKDKVSYALRGDLANGTTEKIKVTVGTPWADPTDTATNDPNDPAVADVPFLKNDGDVATNEKDDVGTSCEILVGGMGDDVLIGDDSLTKGHASDTNLMGDTIYGGPGNDTLVGGQGNDFLYGEAGDDIFDESKYVDSDFDGVLEVVYNAQGMTGQDTFVGGEGVDLVNYEHRSGNLTVVADGDPKTVLTILPLVTTAKNDGETGEFDNVCTDVENIYGGRGGDKLTGNASANVLRGGPGNDELYGLAGNDTFDDKIGWDDSGVDATTPAATDDTATSGNDKFVGGADIDTIDYSLRNVALDCDMVGNTATPSANDGITGETDDVFDDVENILGGKLANTIVGNDLDNVITGGTAADSLSGGKGNDTIDGNGGDDVLLDGGEGNDTIDGRGTQSTGVTTCGAGDDVAIGVVVAAGDISCEIKF